ncbi:MAG TPA: hypothetical protein VFQ64_06990 [Sphingomonas sp.]|nr:hypothetical protein [Sphingomonas sp.]
MPTMLWKLAAGGLIFATAPALAQSPFDGTWKAQLSSMKNQAKPQTYALQGSTYRCVTCTPPYSVPADGQFHKVTGMDYWDEVAISTPDDRTVTYQFKRAGQVIANNTSTISADGLTLSTVSSNTNNGAGTPVETKGSATRVGKPAAGAHLLSGSWAFAPPTAVSDAGMTVSIKTDGDKLQLTSLGETLNATFGGPFALNEGDPGKTMTKAERVGPRSMRLTDMRGGKVVGVTTYTVAPDGKTLTGMGRNMLNGSTNSFTATKQ